MKQRYVNASMQMLFIAFIIAILMLSLLLLSGYVSRMREIPTEVWSEEPITVIIDAGHGGEDGGTSGQNGILEKDLNLDVAKKLDSLLRSAGINTVMTRNDDRLLYDPLSDYKGRKKILDMHERLRIANSCENAVFLSVHMNSFPQQKYSGLQVYYSENSDLSVNLAQTIQDTVIKNLQSSNTRKIKPSGDNIYLLKMISHPSILIECGFLSNSDECALLCSDEYQQKLSLVIYSAIMNYFDSLQNNTSNNT